MRISDWSSDVCSSDLAFGGVKALTDISFEIREHEILAIIGPNGAGKTSMLNVINGFYHPQKGRIEFRGVERRAMRPHLAARQGIARRSEEHTSELTSLMRLSYAVFCLKKKNTQLD